MGKITHCASRFNVNVNLLFESCRQFNGLDPLQLTVVLFKVLGVLLLRIGTTLCIYICQDAHPSPVVP